MPKYLSSIPRGAVRTEDIVTCFSLMMLEDVTALSDLLGRGPLIDSHPIAYFRHVEELGGLISARAGIADIAAFAGLGSTASVDGDPLSE